MSKYGDVAVRATNLVQSGACTSPLEAWRAAAREVFPEKMPSQNKCCPKSAYLGLCEEGVVAGIPRGDYTSSRENKSYALRAVRLLRHMPSLADRAARDGGGMELWRRVVRAEWKHPNGQMDVVLALWSRHLIVRETR